jgi:PAS domain S-box-containing protein
MIFKATLRLRLVLLVLAATLPLLILSLFMSVLNTDAAVKRATASLQAAAALVAANQQQMAETAKQVLTAVAHSPDVLDANGTRCSGYLTELNRLYTVYANLGIIGVDGYARCHGLDNGIAPFLGDRSYVRDAVASRGFVSGEYIFGRLTGKHVFGFALPTLGADGRVNQVAYVVLDLAAISASIADTHLPSTGRVAVIDRNGTVLAAKPSVPGAIGSKLNCPVAHEVLKTKSAGVYEGVDAAGRQRIFAFQPSGAGADSPFFVIVSMERDEVIAAAHRDRNIELLTLTLVALLGAALAWALGGRMIVTPTAEILQATQRVRDGQRGVRVATQRLGAGGEFTDIADGINRMADALGEREAELQSELAKSQRAQRKLVDAQRMGRIGHSEVVMATQQIILSDEVSELFGLEPGAFDGHFDTILQMVHPDDRARFRRSREEAMRGGSELNVEYRIVTPAGDVRWIHQLGRQETDEAGLPTSRIGVMQDITERKRTELALLELTDVLRRTGEIAQIGGWELILDGMRLTWSEQVYRIHEIEGGSTPTLAEAIDFYVPDARPAISAAVQAAIDHGTPWDLELPMVTATGRPIWARSQGQVRFRNGKVSRLVGTLQDVTKRKQVEEAMLESEQRYTALFEAAPLPMWVFDDQTYQFMAVNAAAVTEYGFSREEFLAMNAFDIHPPNELARLRKQLSGMAVLRKASWNHRRKDGDVFPVDVVSKSIRYADRSARFVAALDLTAQREAETTVQEHLFTLQRAADAAAAITWHQTLDGMMQEVADQARGVIGAEQAFVSLSDEEGELTCTIALSVSESHAPAWSVQKLSDFAALFKPVLTSNRPMRFTSSDIRSLRAQQVHAGAVDGVAAGSVDGAEKLPPMRGCLAVSLLGRNGKNIGMLQLSDKYEGEFTQQDEYVAMELARLAAVAMENVQLIEEVNQLNSHLEQKVASRTEELTRQEALFRALAQQAPQVVWTTNPYGQVTYLNQAWFDLVGGKFENWSGLQWYSAVHPDDLPEIQDNWTRASKSSQPFAGVRRLMAKDGSLHTMSYRASPVFNSRGAVSFWVGIDADITEMKAIEAELRLSNQELEAFSYSVSHDLRSPLNTIDGFSRLLAKQINADSSVKAMHYLSRIHAGVAQMGQLIEDILSLAQVSRVQLRHELIDLSAMAAKGVEALRVRDPAREVSVRIEGQLQAYGDSRLVSVVMENLLGNAWKFSSQRADASIAVGQTIDPAGRVSFFVRDNGAGFDMAYADKLFRAFQRLHTAAEFPGTGIGLATVNRIIARHGGELWAESALNQGATFFFTLPKFPAPV